MPICSHGLTQLSPRAAAIELTIMETGQLHGLRPLVAHVDLIRGYSERNAVVSRSFNAKVSGCCSLSEPRRLPSDRCRNGRQGIQKRDVRAG